MSTPPPQDGAVARPPPVPITRPAPATAGRSVAGLLNNRRLVGSTPIPPSLQAKMAAFASRTPNNNVSVDAATDDLKKAGISERAMPPPPLRAPASAPAPGGRPGSLAMGGLAARRMGKAGLPKLSGMDMGLQNAGLGGGRPNQESEQPPRHGPSSSFSTPFANFGKIVDPTGRLVFNNAVLHEKGVDFVGGASFSINMAELQLDEELGKGNYGTVKKVFHKPTKVMMAMKEIRLELEDAKLNAIIMELDILHRAVAPEIVGFYGAFFIESCVYYCMEYMDAGSLDKLQGEGVPEDILARITSSMVRGLKFLKDGLQIIHRDVKPTNVLVNRKGQVKLCDFGVSGQLEKSLAKTNIGCQSYMAPERIRGESQNNVGTYTVSSDVWSLGLSIIEMALGHYPYPPETYANVFAQLTAIVDGDPPELPEDFTGTSRDFVARCLHKIPDRRATYTELLEHPFLVEDVGRDVDMAGWVEKAIEAREARIRAHIEAQNQEPTS